MDTVVFLVDRDPEEARWIEAALSSTVASVHALDDAESLLALLGVRANSCLVISMEPDESSVVEMLRELRLSGSMIPVIVIGPATSLRPATDIAKIQLTEFVERPLTACKLVAAILRSREQERLTTGGAT